MTAPPQKNIICVDRNGLWLVWSPWLARVFLIRAGGWRVSGPTKFPAAVNPP